MTMTGPIYNLNFSDAVRARIEDGSYTDRYIARTNEGKLYLTDTGHADNKISTEMPDHYDIDEVIGFYMPAASRAEELVDLAEVLTAQGEFYHGDRVDEVAVEWLDAGFDASAANDWMIAKVWQAWVARDLVALGRIPDELREIDDDLIYAWCNNDAPVVWPTTDDEEESV
jgi:hypothetical protein